MKYKKILLWFRNDLRLTDNEVLVKALKNGEELIPLYCFDERQFVMTSLGFPRTDHFRAQFLIESVEDLKKNLQQAGSDLVVRIGKPEEVIPSLAEELNVDAVFCSKEVTDEELQIENKIEHQLWKNKKDFVYYWTSTLFHIEDLPFPINNIPDVFTEFRKQIEKTTHVRDSLQAPTSLPALASCIERGAIPSLSTFGLPQKNIDKRAVLLFKGGESAGLQRLKEYFWEKSMLKNYKETRNELLGADYSSKFSPWLANGSLSARIIYEEVKKYEKIVLKNDSTYWMIFELLWRDYFRFIAKKYGNRIFHLEGIRKNNLGAVHKNMKNFKKWIDGATGVPFIDANMEELKFTGFMSNRGRQNVASFLTKDLKINWTYGAMYFESKLIDYDVCSNWGNWTYIAGVGNDPRENRYFNILSQARRYDPKGEYVKYWLPQLQEIPQNKIHYPEEWSREEQKKAGCIIGKDYPKNIISFERWVHH